MDLVEIKQELDKTAKRLADFRSLFDLDTKQARIDELDETMADPNFWNDQQAAQTVINEANGLKDAVNQFNHLDETYENLQISHELVKEEYDEDLAEELVSELKELISGMNDFELQLLLSEPYDKNNAILELHPGAGGTESQDWGSMLLRMYTRWAEKKVSK